MTLAGMNTINLSQLNTFQQVILFVLILLGSAIWVSIAVLHFRRKAFERKFKRIVEAGRQKRRDRRNSRSSSRGPLPSPNPPSRPLTRPNSPVKYVEPAQRPEVNGPAVRESNMSAEKRLSRGEVNELLQSANEEIPNNVQALPNAEPAVNVASNSGSMAAGDTATPAIKALSIDVGVSRRITFASLNSPARGRPHRQFLSMQGVGARQGLENHPLKTPPARYSSELSRPKEGEAAAGPTSYHGFLSSGLVGRNSQFAGLTLAERERLGGVEYRAVSILAILVPAYFVLWQLFGCIGLGAYVAHNRRSATAVNAENPWWVGAFNGVSAFNNSGMSLLDANMVAFQTSNYMLITMGLMILAGNTCYPVFLRLIIWTMFKLMPDSGRFHEHRVTLRFLLDHPRRCYTNLFPSRHTWWLLATLVALNGVDWAAFEVLNIGNSTITSLPRGVRALDGLFQALAVRSGGFYVVPIPSLRIGLLILYVIMMYISVYPVVITMRNSNVYEERSLGIYADDPQEKRNNGSASKTFYGRLKRTVSNQGNSAESRGYFVRQQLRGQLAHDLWWVVLAVLLITIVETSNFERDPVSYSVFNILFEVVSSYGCVGISIGLPNVAYSFCGGWHKLSKLLLCAVMIRGRHRGLPVAIDRAVLLPGEHLAAAEEEDAQIRLDRSATVNRGVV